MPKIVVLGAGINGISTALAIQESIPKCQVTVISDRFSPNTTSDVAAGLIEPYLCDDDVDRIIKWTRATILRIQEYMTGGHPGAEEQSGYCLSSVKSIPKWLEVMKNVHILSEEEMKEVAKRPEHKFGFFYTTWYLEPTAYIKWETEQFLKNGGQFLQQKINKIDDVSKMGYDVIVNCTGLGSREMVGDKEVYPTRGQVLRVECPRVKHFLIDDEYYALLNENTITLGGTKDRNQWNTTINPILSQKIFEENCRNIPSLRSARILSAHVDLRPTRGTVRLEAEPNGKVIHNYGHGGSGITLHWGCAMECVNLVKKMIMEEKKNSKI
ncbi:hypothetical protein GCK72_015394 [Caenorhabditis remanei]|uniref:FAD dependent oxidoreductase domain-containing protein n=1 Tax=Caenorhabditis remanei TaxID=31234 RepID=A0A6A5GW93_CAERE|nr:hypothetical protein GCK72_015394 [Caenorhabditis remanei]KAF1758934.1 hypothetical protein GCK72_015394 [Caenorhabditis remanei]